MAKGGEMVWESLLIVYAASAVVMAAIVSKHHCLYLDGVLILRLLEWSAARISG
jgi:hypothetical protein